MNVETARENFRFSESDHSYWLNKQRVPSITQLIRMGGLLGSAEPFFTEASRDRGTEIHRLCSELDLGALDLLTLDSPHRGYVLAYVAACAALKPSWEAIEEPEVEPIDRFAGRIDRVGIMFGRPTICEIKTGGKLPAAPITYEVEGKTITVPNTTAAPHAVQVALGAKLWARRYGIPAKDFQRLVIYPKATGKFTVDSHCDGRDFLMADALIRRFC